MTSEQNSNITSSLSFSISKTLSEQKTCKVEISALVLARFIAAWQIMNQLDLFSTDWVLVRQIYQQISHYKTHRIFVKLSFRSKREI